MGGWSGGVYTRFRNWVTDKANSINPQASLFDQEDDGFAAGLNNCITKDGLNKPSSAMDWNGQALTGVNNFAAAAGKFIIAVNGTIVSTPSSGVAITATAGGSSGAFFFSDNGNNAIGLFNSTAAGGGFVQFTRNGVSKAFIGDASQLISGGTLDDLAIRGNGSKIGFGFTGGPYKMVVDSTLGTQAADDGGTLQTVGWRDTPPNIVVANYQLVLADRGKMVVNAKSGSAMVLTIPPTATVAWTGGASIAVYNNSGSQNVNITRGGGVSLFLAGDSSFTNADRVLSPGGSCTLFTIQANQWAIAGIGVS